MWPTLRDSFVTGIGLLLVSVREKTPNFRNGGASEMVPLNRSHFRNNRVGSARLDKVFLAGIGRGLARKSPFLVTKQPLRRERFYDLFRALLFQKALADLVQIVGHHAQPHIALIPVQAFVQAAI